VVSKRSIQHYRRRGSVSPSSQTWRTFVTNHASHLWAADLLTVQTLTFKTLYVLAFIAHDRRELMHVNVTAWKLRICSPARKRLVANTPRPLCPASPTRTASIVVGFGHRLSSVRKLFQGQDRQAPDPHKRAHAANYAEDDRAAHTPELPRDTAECKAQHT
jgi:hypothetical protein